MEVCANFPHKLESTADTIVGESWSLRRAIDFHLSRKNLNYKNMLVWSWDCCILQQIFSCSYILIIQSLSTAFIFSRISFVFLQSQDIKFIKIHSCNIQDGEVWGRPHSNLHVGQVGKSTLTVAALTPLGCVWPTRCLKILAKASLMSASSICFTGTSGTWKCALILGQTHLYLVCFFIPKSSYVCSIWQAYDRDFGGAYREASFPSTICSWKPRFVVLLWHSNCNFSFWLVICPSPEKSEVLVAYI